MNTALLALLLSLPAAIATTPGPRGEACDDAMVPPREIGVEPPLRKILGDILSTEDLRPAGPPPFPGDASARPWFEAENARRQIFLIEIGRRLVAAGLEQLRADASANSPERDCVIESIGCIEGTAFNLRAFRDDAAAYLRERFRAVVTPMAGDLLVYSATPEPPPRRVMHFAVVRAVHADGGVIAESKFGRVPGVYLHRLEDAPDFYGNFVRIYRRRPEPLAQSSGHPADGKTKPPFPGLKR